MKTRLFSQYEGSITGTQDIIEFVHGLQINGQKVTPDEVGLEFIQSSDTSGTAAAGITKTLTGGGAVPAAGTTVTVGGAAFTEVFTFRAAASLPFEVQIGATVAETILNLIAAINAYTIQFIKASVGGAANQMKLEPSTSRGGQLDAAADRGYRDFTGCATTWAGAAWAGAAGTPAKISGSPEWAVLHKDSERVFFRVRGMMTTDTMGFRAEARRMHSISRSPVPQRTSTAIPGDVVVNGVTFTQNPITTSYVTLGVKPGDLLCIADPTDPTNNGSYKISTVTASVLTVETPFRKTGTFSAKVGPYATTLKTEAGLTGQIPFDLPSPDYQGPTPPDEVYLPGIVRGAGTEYAIIRENAAGTNPEAGPIDLYDGAATPEGSQSADIGDIYARASVGLLVKGGADGNSRGWGGLVTTPGAPDTGTIVLGAQPAAGETIVVTRNAITRTYEWNAATPPAGGTAGMIWVYIGGVLADAQANILNALNGVVDAPNIEYNGLTSHNFLATQDGDNIILATATAPGGDPIADDGVPVTLSETMVASPLNYVQDFGGGYGPVPFRCSAFRVTLTAEHVTAGLFYLRMPKPFIGSRAMATRHSALGASAVGVDITNAAGNCLLTVNCGAGPVADIVDVIVFGL